MLTISSVMPYSQNRQVKTQNFGRFTPERELFEPVASVAATIQATTINAAESLQIQKTVDDVVFKIADGDCRLSIKAISALGKLFDTLAE